MAYEHFISETIIENTLVDFPRLYKIQDMLKKTAGIEGHIAEVGVYKGGTASIISYCMESMASHKRLYLFDTFEGLPTPDSTIDTHKKGDFKDTSISHVESLLRINCNYSIYKGIFPKENSEYVEHHTFSLVHLDVDIYPSVKECLEFFYPRMAKRGIIILDDYNAPTCPGAKKAADEFAKLNNIRVIETVQSQAIIRKPY